MCSTPSGIPADHHIDPRALRGGERLCSTPSGIPADHHGAARDSTHERAGAQRLPASPPITTRGQQRARARGRACSTPSGIPADHHVGAWEAVGGGVRAQRLPASPPITTGGPAGARAAGGRGAQRLPASPPITTSARAAGLVPILVLNAFRHPRRSPLPDQASTDALNRVLNAFRHPRRSPRHRAPRLPQPQEVLNAFRHPRRSPRGASASRASPRSCSTPSGIPADHHARTSRWTATRPCAQRLPASPPITTTSPIHSGPSLPKVLNAFRHPRRSPPATVRASRCTGSCAQRLPASPPITTAVVAREPRVEACSTPSGIPADHHPLAGVGSVAARGVLNAFRHPRRSPPPGPSPSARRPTSAQRLPASPPITTRRCRRGSTPRSVLNAFRHPRRSPLAPGGGRRAPRRGAQRLPASPPITTDEQHRDHPHLRPVLNAFRHPRRSPPPLSRAGSCSARCSTPSGIPADHHILAKQGRCCPSRCSTPSGIPADHHIDSYAIDDKSAKCSTPSGIPADHHRRPVALALAGYLCSTPSGIPADHHPPWVPPCVPPPWGAQRLPASPPITTRYPSHPERFCQVLNAFRHPRRSPPDRSICLSPVA